MALLSGEPVTVIVKGPILVLGVVDIVSVVVQEVLAPVGVHEPGEKLAVAPPPEIPVGKPLAAKETDRAVPLNLVTVMVALTELGFITLVLPLLDRE